MNMGIGRALVGGRGGVRGASRPWWGAFGEFLKAFWLHFGSLFSSEVLGQLFDHFKAVAAIPTRTYVLRR